MEDRSFSWSHPLLPASLPQLSLSTIAQSQAGHPFLLLPSLLVCFPLLVMHGRPSRPLAAAARFSSFFLFLFLFARRSSCWCRGDEEGSLMGFAGDGSPVSGGGISENGRFSYGYASFPGKRASMEDFYETRIDGVDGETVGLFGVFDGHGGARAAEYVKQHLFSNLIKHPKFISDTKSAIAETYNHTDSEFLKADSSHTRDAGSTASTAILVGDRLLVANVGDSRAVVCRGGDAIAVSRDHKPDQSDERQRIEDAGGFVMWAGTWRVGGVLAVSRAFGDKLLKQYVVADPEIKEEVLDSSLKFLILASDGLWDVVTNEEAVAMVKRGMGQMGGDGHQQRQFQYQALLAAVHTMTGQGQQNPNQTLPFPLPLPFPAGPGADASTHNAIAAPPSPTPRGFADWSASSSAFTSLAAQATPATSNAFHYSLSPCYAFWTHYMLNNNAYCSYPPAPHQEHAHPFCHNDNRAKDPGPASSFGFESFTTTSLAPNICAHMPPIEGPIFAKETETSEDLPRAVKSSDERATRNSGELKCEAVDTLPESKQGHESCATKLNSGEYQVILRKELTKSDVGNVGRIVLPKKDAEASFPPLFQRDPMILQMDDMVLPVTWKFKYRYWPNNKSRMYILDATGEFVKTHGLQAGDALIIYRNSAPGKFIIRGEKAIQLATNP